MKEPIFWTPHRLIIRTTLLLLVGLLSSGCADANKGGIPLQALLDNDLAKVERALQRGASPERFRDPDPRRTLGDNPFSVVIEQGSVEMAELLLRYGLNPDGLASRITGQIFLQYAEQRKRYDIMAVLIRAGADLNARGVKGYAGLAMKEEDGALMDAILGRVYARDEKACPNTVWPHNTSFLMYYFPEQNYTQVEPLLKAGTNPNLDDPREFSALVSALSIGDKQLRERVLHALIRHGARTDLAAAYVRQMGFTSFEQYVLYELAMEDWPIEERKASFELVEELGIPFRAYPQFLIANGKLEMPREYGIIFNSPDKNAAVGEVRKCLVRVLLAQEEGWSDELLALHDAMAHEDMPRMKRVLEAGANANEKFRDMSPIYYAWFYGKTLESRKAMLQLLVEHGADINEAGSFSRSFPENNVAALFLDTQPPELYCIVLPEHDTCR